MHYRVALCLFGIDSKGSFSLGPELSSKAALNGRWQHGVREAAVPLCGYVPKRLIQRAKMFMIHMLHLREAMIHLFQKAKCKPTGVSHARAELPGQGEIEPCAYIQIPHGCCRKRRYRSGREASHSEGLGSGLASSSARRRRRDGWRRACASSQGASGPCPTWQGGLLDRCDRADPACVLSVGRLGPKPGAASPALTAARTAARCR